MKRTLKRTFFSAESAHGTRSSHGFCNDHIVYAFESKKARDKYVADRSESNISVRACRKNEVANELPERPRPFSGEYLGIVDVKDYPVFGEPDVFSAPDGFVGEVMVADGSGAPCGLPIVRRVW